MILSRAHGGPIRRVDQWFSIFQRDAIVASKSSDGGLTWGEPAIVQIDGVDGAGNPTPSPYF